jgi:hypothetical protein
MDFLRVWACMKSDAVAPPEDIDDSLSAPAEEIEIESFLGMGYLAVGAAW